MNQNISNNDIIVLDDQKQYIVVEKIVYKNDIYAYLCELGNVNNIKFVQIESDSNLSIIEPDETELLKNLILLCSKDNH